MLSHNDLKKGVEFIFNDQPYEVLESNFVYKARGSSIVQAKVKNLISGNVIAKTFHPGDSFEEAEINTFESKFLYKHRDKYIFCEVKDPSKRFDLTEETIGEPARFLKANQVVQGLIFNGKIINIILPIKTQLKVAETPPGVRGDRAQGGTKVATLETGANVNVPLFVEAGDTIEINTETGEYSRRIDL